MSIEPRLTLSEHHEAEAHARRFNEAVESVRGLESPSGRTRRLMAMNDLLIAAVCADIAGGSRG